MSESTKTSRRDVLKAGLATAAAGLAPVPEAAAATAKKGAPPGGTGKPNILFLLVDEQRYPTAYESAALKEFRAKFLPRSSFAEAASARAPLRCLRRLRAEPHVLYTSHYPSLHRVANTDSAAKTPQIGDVLAGAQLGSDPAIICGPAVADAGRPYALETICSRDANSADDMMLGYPDAARSSLSGSGPADAYGFEDGVGPGRGSIPAQRLLPRRKAAAAAIRRRRTSRGAISSSKQRDDRSSSWRRS
jgi:hypothetical protein